MNTRNSSKLEKATILALGSLFASVLAGSLTACSVDAPTTIDKPKTSKPAPTDDNPANDPNNSPTNAVGSEDNTFDHQQSLGDDAPEDPFSIAQQRQQEGPPEVRTRLHSCQKIPVQTLANILTGLGVDLTKTSKSGPQTAGELLSQGQTALGGANYDARTGEALMWTTAGAAKQFDIFVQAAPEIIANIGTAPTCQVNGAGPTMFNDDNTCNKDAISCIIGRPATDDHVAICNSLVTSASDPDKGKTIAVATLLAAAHSCE